MKTLIKIHKATEKWANNINYWLGLWEVGSVLYCQWKFKLKTFFGKAIHYSLIKFKLHAPLPLTKIFHFYESSLDFTCVKEVFTCVLEYMGTRMFIALLFVIIKRWK